MDPALLPHPLRALGRPGMARHLQAVDQGVRALLRDGRGERHHHVVPVRHQLAGVHAESGQHRGAAPRLRGAHRFLPRGDLSRRDALRHEPRSGLGARALRGHGGGRHDDLGLLDPRPQLVDAYPAGARDRRQPDHRRGLAAGDLQSVVSLPLYPHAARLRAHRVLRGRGAFGVAAAARARGRFGAEYPAHRARRRRGARAAADSRRRPARLEHARAPAGEDRGDRGDLEDAEERSARSLRRARRRKTPQRFRRRDPEGREPDPQARRGGRGAGHRRLRARCRAGGTGVLRVPGDGGDGGADAARGVERRVGDAPGHAAATMDAVGFLGVHFRGMDRDARRLARHRDRQAALARDRDSQDPRSGGRRVRRAARREPHRLHHHVYSDADRVPGGADAPRGQRRQRMSFDLPLVFAALMGLAILMYVVLDGYDLGVGMLMPAAHEREQDVMVASIGPFWDANETWLVLGVGILLVAFPAAHGLVLGALYLPVAAMLVGLMLRGVAFEFRVKAEGWHRGLWNWLFWFGSFLASFAQGLMLGRYVTGFHSGFGYYVFAMLVGASLCGGYVLLGATWLILKTDGALQKKALAWARERKSTRLNS